MQIISGTTDFLLQGASAVAIGKFDGMHRGHKALLSEILEAKKRGLQAVVFTFDPPPAVLFSGKAVKGLTTREEKRRLFRQIGIDVLIEFPLTFQTAAISPEDFLRVIVQEQIRAKLVAAGTDLSFGDRGLGDCKLLKARAEAYGYEVKIIDKVLEDGEEISSTRVRQAVEAGKMQEAGKTARRALCGDGNGCARQTVRTYNRISHRQPDASCRQAFAAKRRVPLGGGMQQWCF